MGVTGDGRIDMDDLVSKISGTKLVSLSAASNVTGAILEFAKLRDIMESLSEKPLLVIDGSQALPHFRVDVEKYGIDFFIAT